MQFSDSLINATFLSRGVLRALISATCCTLALHAYAETAEVLSQTTENAAIIEQELLNTLYEDIEREDIYQIELLVFADDYKQFANSEQWPEPQELSYPEDVLAIYDETELKQQIATIKDKTKLALLELAGLVPVEPGADNNSEIVPDTDARFEDLSQTPAGALTIDLSETVSGNEAEHAPLNSSQPGSQLGSQPQALNSDKEPEIPLPLLMVALTEAKGDYEKSLNKLYKTLKHRSRYRTLLYRQWLQPLSSKDSAKPILMQGGETLQQRFELEGSITLSKGRFLHITTDLWFINWQPAYALEDEPWYIEKAQGWNVPHAPEIPMHPVADYYQQELTKAEQELAIEQEKQQIDITDYSSETDDAKELAISSAADFIEEADSLQVILDTQEEITTEEMMVDAADIEPVELPPVAQQVYRLNEYRRLKRDEIHYLDHPLFGVVVRISKWE